ncbi:MAG: hypothetical protein IPM69_07630 [Ignavibacteria bacterium]|nr:hypothetical protein [Ignavibacteria bacterium]
MNIPSIELYKSNTISYAKITVQLYDNATDSILIDKKYIGDWSNPGFEFACPDSSVDCALNNAMLQALSEIVYTIGLHSPTLKRQRQLAQERFDKLVYTYLPQPFDTLALSRIISPLDTTINLTHVFQSFFSPDSGKFVSFFLLNTASQDIKLLQNNLQDKSVNFITSKKIGDEGYFEDIPQRYAYIVKGVKYNGKWYYKKAYATYFAAANEEEGKQKFFSNILSFDFFKENTAEYSTDFWEERFFKKIVDLRKDPDWDKYGQSMWKSRERENRPYIGMYDVVVSEQRKELEEQLDAREHDFYNRYLKPLVLSANAQDTFKFEPLTKSPNDFLLIHPANFSTVLSPVNVHQNGNSIYIRYFVFIQQSDSTYLRYEWKYLKPTDFKITEFGLNFTEQINSLTEWDYSYDYVEDEKFWNDYVLAKSGDSYLYLTEIK